MTHYQALGPITDYLVKNYSPEKIIVFGSCARRAVRPHSDIDLCLVLPAADKRQLRAEIGRGLMELVDYDVDLIIMTPEEWERDAYRSGTFAGLIREKGVVLYG
ncbi:nucleotidyltransferase domain-containing protein [Sporolituus thermophilus]|uniref:Nucleotidyltransferase domain-containing protein n=1 Tax=Sporolituus thermophilus DSM 23256 TaxID=1123285 RepID=A0A1G7NF59_9FIRM|nr:nucleotidyltransferase domain-containing protein [Sporolituus thermophilus]SDF72698.1 Nucleotidyltransferase domain-containing protein [Sporolituus thermophilus DSM 23256]